MPQTEASRMVSNHGSIAARSTRSCVLHAVVLGLALSAIAGCGGPEVYPVEGVVVYSDGATATDLENYTVAFELASPQETSGGPRVSATGTVQANGTFTVGTYETDDGAAPGKHRVALSPPVQASDEVVIEEVLDPKFYSFKTSGLEATIGPGTNEVKLTVQRRKR